MSVLSEFVDTAYDIGSHASVLGCIPAGSAQHPANSKRQPVAPANLDVAITEVYSEAFTGSTRHGHPEGHGRDALTELSRKCLFSAG